MIVNVVGIIMMLVGAFLIMRGRVIFILPNKGGK